TSMRDELGWLGGLLGDVRDTEVLLDRLEARVEQLAERDHDAGKHLLDALRDHRDGARTRLLDGLRSDRHLALLDELVPATQDQALADDEDEDDDDDVAILIDKPWRNLRKAVEALDDDPPDPELHRVRILAKRARYAAEAITPSVGKAARRFAA